MAAPRQLSAERTSDGNIASSEAATPDRRRQLVRWLPVVAWAALIFALSSIPSLSSGLGTWDLVLRKAAHITEYAVLGALLVRALVRQLPALAAGVAYACTDEIHQHFVPGRNGSPTDVFFDAVGVLAGILLLQRLRGRRPGRQAE